MSKERQVFGLSQADEKSRRLCLYQLNFFSNTDTFLKLPSCSSVFNVILRENSYDVYKLMAVSIIRFFHHHFKKDSQASIKKLGFSF